MFSIDFKVNGRSIRPNQIANELERAMLQKVSDHIERQVGSVSCPTHGQYAKITATGRSLEELNFQIEGCCDDLIKRVEQKLK